MHKQWIGCSPDNFKVKRMGSQPEAIVLHRTGGSLADIAARCRRPQGFTSTHYAVGRNGEVHQYVEEADTAFHAGVVVNPTCARAKLSGNPNLYTIAIEFEGSGNDEYTDAQYQTAAELVADIAGRYGFPADADRVLLHSEIRAGRSCPSPNFNRERLLGLRPKATPDPATTNPRDVRVLKNANVREGKPSTQARIARVAKADTTESVTGFTDQGERVAGNSYWYRTEDGNFFWAGVTDTPNPVASTEPEPVPAPPPPLQPAAGPQKCGIDRIDSLLADVQAPPITNAETDRSVVGALQDLLIGHGFSDLPTVLSSSYGIFGAKTATAIQSFQTQESLNATGGTDSATLQRMVSRPAKDPRASRVYLALVLGYPFTGMHRILSLVAQMEGVGKFGAINRNTDRAGLSFGLIQWAQRPGRLTEILRAMLQADRDQFVGIFGGGDESVASALIAHCAKLDGGVVHSTGVTVNPAFDLVNEPWLSRFRQAALVGSFQRAQVEAALIAFNKSLAGIRRFAPDLVSERSVGFMIDVANQFGDGGVEKLYRACHRDGMSEMDVLEAIADETVARIEDNFKAGVRTRRDRFLNTPFLTNDPFVPGA